jgi:ABC-type multidrug transport system ATPase subunit
VRDYVIRKEKGEKIRKTDNKLKKSMRIIDEAITDFRNGRLSVKEFLYLIASRYEPDQTEHSEEMSDEVVLRHINVKKYLHYRFIFSVY